MIVYSYAGVRQSGKATYHSDSEDGAGLTPTSQAAYSYNARGRLESVDIDGAITSYKYDDNGLQVSRTELSDTKLFLLDRQNQTGYAQVFEQKDLITGDVERAYLIGHAILGQRDGPLPRTWRSCPMAAAPPGLCSTRPERSLTAGSTPMTLTACD